MPRAKKRGLGVALVELDASAPHAKVALDSFRAAKKRALKQVAEEKTTKRKAVDSLRRVYTSLCDDFLRVKGTTYQGWLDHGPKAELEELVAAAQDDAIWDRLVDTYEARVQ
jgi:hypothetical protein